MVERGSGRASRWHPSVHPFRSSTYSLILCLDLSSFTDHLHLVMECRCAYLILWFSGLDNMQLTMGTMGYGFSSGHVWMWELDCEESWAPKNWYFWTVVLAKTLESPLDCKIQPVHSKGDQPWVFFGRNDAKAETPVLWPPHAKSWLIGKTDAGRDWGQEEKGTTEDEMAGWHHRLDGRGFGWTLGVGDRKGVLRFMGSQRVRHDWVTELNWTEVLWNIKDV